MNEQTLTTATEAPAVAGRLGQPIKPRAWCVGASYWPSRDSVPYMLRDEAEPLYDQAALDAAVAAERERWIGGAHVNTPTWAMEQEFTAQRRMGVAQERKRIERLCEAAMYQAKEDPNAKAVDLLGRLLARVRA